MVRPPEVGLFSELSLMPERVVASISVMVSLPGYIRDATACACSRWYSASVCIERRSVAPLLCKRRRQICQPSPNEIKLWRGKCCSHKLSTRLAPISTSSVQRRLARLEIVPALAVQILVQELALTTRARLLPLPRPRRRRATGGGESQLDAELLHAGEARGAVEQWQHGRAELGRRRRRSQIFPGGR